MDMVLSSLMAATEDPGISRILDSPRVLPIGRSETNGDYELTDPMLCDISTGSPSEKATKPL